MATFVCDKCGCNENTATSNYWIQLSHGTQTLCSQCDPKIGKWHNRFPRTWGSCEVTEKNDWSLVS